MKCRNAIKIQERLLKSRKRAILLDLMDPCIMRKPTKPMSLAEIMRRKVKKKLVIDLVENKKQFNSVVKNFKN